MRKCSRCKEDKPECEFYPNRKRGIPCAYCKKCSGEKIKEYWSKPENKRRKIASNHGLSAAEYDRMIELQNNKCAICGKPETARLLAIDHCHASGDVRGLLCGRCNRGIGMFSDDVSKLEAAAKYLTFWQGGVSSSPGV